MYLFFQGDVHSIKSSRGRLWLSIIDTQQRSGDAKNQKKVFLSNHCYHHPYHQDYKSSLSSSSLIITIMIVQTHKNFFELTSVGLINGSSSDAFLLIILPSSFIKETISNFRLWKWHKKLNELVPFPFFKQQSCENGKNDFSPRFDSVRNLLERARAKLTRGGERGSGSFGFITVIYRSYLQV